MAARATSSELVGRADELARWDAVLDRASANEPCLMLIGGEAGIGKSRLLTSFLASVQARGGSVLPGTCVPMAELHLPYAPVAGALAGALANGSGAGIDTDDSVNLCRLFRASVDHLGGRGPVVLAIEDMHWADASTISLLGLLHRQLRADPVIIIVTYRDDELAEHPLRDWLAEAVRLDGTEQLRLRRFSRAEFAAHATGILGTPPDTDHADAVFARSAGNPLYTELLLASGDPMTDLPDTIVELTLRRVRWLSAPAQEIVRLASVCGPRVPHTMLASLVSTPACDLTAALRQATDYHLLVADPAADTYAFSHPLVRETVYAHCLPAERREWHCRIMALLSRNPDRRMECEISRHALAAGHHAAALQAAVRAGLAAFETSAIAEAYEQLGRAAQLWETVDEKERPTEVDHSGILTRAAAAADLLGHDRQAVSWMEAAVRVAGGGAEPERLASMYEQLGRHCVASARFEPAWAAYQKGLSLQPSAVVRARILAGLAELASCWSRHAEAQRCATEAIALARTAGTVREEARARCALGMSMVGQGRAREGLEELRTAENEGGPDVHIDLADCLVRVGELDKAIEVSLAGLERRSGALLLCHAAGAAIGLGRWSQAETWLEMAADHGLRGARSFPLWRQSASLAIGRGEFAAARRRLDRAKALIQPGSGPPRWIRALATEEAELAVWQGRLDDARDAVTQGLQAIDGNDEEALAGRLLAIGLRVEADAAAWARARRIATTETDARSRSLLDRSKKLAALPDQAAFAELCAAEAARALDEPATGLWQEALRSFQVLNRPWLEAYTGFRLSEAMLQTATEAPETVLRAAWQQAQQLGANALSAEIETLATLYRLRLASPEALRAGHDQAGAGRLGLTPREVEVLRHVAAGSSNNEIARSLYISAKTASVHVTNIMRKLNSPNRREAARTAYLLGVIERPR